MKNVFTCTAAALVLACLSMGCSKKKADGSQAAKSSAGKSDSSEGSQSGSTQDQPDKSAKGGAQANDIVKIPLEDQQRAGIRTEFVLVQRMPRTLSAAGQVVVDEQHTSHLGAVADGRITAVNVLPGANVRRGQVLATLHSHTVHETVGALVQAYAAVDRQHGAVVFARQAQERYHHLYSIQAASLEESQRADQELLGAQKMLVEAEANVYMEREHLSELLQVSPDSLNQGNLYDRELVPIRSPIDGVVIGRNLSVGQVVDTGFLAFDISNLSTVWVTAAVNQQDLGLIHQGAATDVLTTGFPESVLQGHVAMLGDTLDPDTRTVPVRIVVRNPEARLRPGMFASAQIAEAETREAIFVPESALQDINGMPVVFVTIDGTTFQARTVTLGTRSMKKAEIVEGLKPGDRVVINGAFMVKSEMLKGTMGDG